MKKENTLLEDIYALLEEQNRQTREFLNVNEAAAFLGVSKSQLYKLTSGRKIKFTKPSGKKIFFKKEDLINWIQQNPQATIDEQAETILDHLRKNRNKS